jgi:hypothetical protein
LAAAVLGACAQSGKVSAPAKIEPVQPAAAAEDAAAKAPPVAAKRADPMADVPGDKPLPPLKGAMERIGCTSGSSDLHRVGVETRGGQVVYVAYYNKLGPRTCSLELTRDAPGSKWRLMPDGATRVHTPEGVVIIRTSAKAYELEFQNVARRTFCGTPGQIDGSIAVDRSLGKRECTVRGLQD